MHEGFVLVKTCSLIIVRFWGCLVPCSECETVAAALVVIVLSRWALAAGGSVEANVTVKLLVFISVVGDADIIITVVIPSSFVMPT